MRLLLRSASLEPLLEYIRMGAQDRLVDVTKGDLLPSLIQIAWPCIFQAVLSNCYAFNDYLFVAHIPDPQASASGTAALSATIGLQVIKSFSHRLCC